MDAVNRFYSFSEAEPLYFWSVVVIIAIFAVTNVVMIVRERRRQ
ncbi:hypothetical protein [Bradyrhizobium japonicum]|nr:hypothetical protein [Bradyrhizobium japonicum]MEB2675152.1 hypothetical protein [Bradyrhizobium japonicum]WLB25025.1 hypothetical protein QIH85_24410 [Bradyrhizobium japonicum]WRI85529.1 hypothetical protein R3F75_26475 [Bradyrhizobium japonicum]